MRPETEYCEKCNQRLPRKKESIRSYENGFKISADGRERWKTKEAEQQRKDEVFERDGIDRNGMPFWKCANCGRGSYYRYRFEVDHIIKRSTNRDDRLKNLQLLGTTELCGCHARKHDEFKKKAAKNELATSNLRTYRAFKRRNVLLRLSPLR